MYQKNLSKTISVRVTEEQYKTIKEISKLLNISQSTYLKMLVSSSIVSYNKLNDKLTETIGEISNVAVNKN